eukprot:gene4588-5727_t
MNQIDAILDDCINKKKSNAILVTGPQGSGKSSLVNHCLKKFTNTTPTTTPTDTNNNNSNDDEGDGDDNHHHQEVVIKSTNNSFSIIKLSGFLHFSDSFALKVIARELNIDIPKSISHPDLLQYIKTMLGKESLELTYNNNTNNQYLHNRAMAQQKQQQIYRNKSIIVIVDDFESMVKHNKLHKQQLLYNLLDLAQFESVCLSFIAITSHHDISTSLEKRIKSRFAQDKIQVIPPQQFSQIITIMKNGLTLGNDFNISNEYKDVWNNSVNNIFNDPKILEKLNFQYQMFNTVPPFFNIIKFSLQYLNEDTMIINSKMMMDSIDYQPKDTYAQLLEGISIMEFTILGCIYKLLEKSRPGEPISFNDLYSTEYKRFSTSYYRTSDVTNKFACLRGVQNLLKLRIIRKEGSETGEFIRIKLTFDPDAIPEVALKREDCPTALQKYICNWLE